MNFKNGTYHLIASALADFKRNKVRTFLTSLGIMIGVLSVVMLIALGLGLRNYISDAFEGLGANIVFVMPGEGLGSGPASIIGGVQFDERDVGQLKTIDEAEYVVPIFFKTATIATGTEEEAGYLMGVSEEFFPMMDVEVNEGELFGASDLQGRAKKVVVGASMAEKLFDDPIDGVGKTIRVDSLRLKVVGVIEKTGDNETDNSVIMPYTSTFGVLNPDKTFFSIQLGVLSEDDVLSVKEQTEEILLKRYEDSDFAVMEQGEILDTINQIFGIINGVLVAIGSISLIVGGIGIMNIMYASVTERTKEVGIRRAIGATKKDIMLQFLTESVILSVFGGLLGLVLAAVLVFFIRFFFPVAINLLAVVISFGVSAGIGVFFGVFPARRAANLAPIEAIRYE